MKKIEDVKAKDGEADGIKDKATDIPLKLSVIPKHKYIGVDSSLITTQICATVKARELLEDEKGNDTSVISTFSAFNGFCPIVAQNVVITIKSSGNNEIKEVFHKRAILRENGSYTIVLGDFYADQSRDCVFEVELIIPTVCDGSTPVPHAHTYMEYTDTIKKNPITTFETPVICSIIRPNGSEVSTKDPQWLQVDAVNEMKPSKNMDQEINFEDTKEHTTGWEKITGREYAQIVKTLGHGRVECFCFDGITRLGHIRRKMRKKLCVTSGDIVLIEKGDLNDAKVNILHKYAAHEARNLKQYGVLPDAARTSNENCFNSLMSYNFDEEDDIGINFDDI